MVDMWKCVGKKIRRERSEKKRMKNKPGKKYRNIQSNLYFLFGIILIYHLYLRHDVEVSCGPDGHRACTDFSVNRHTTRRQLHCFVILFR